MNRNGRVPLLNSADPYPVREFGRKSSGSPFLLVGDHAGAAVPQALGDLGVVAADWQRHIALDLGVEGLGIALSKHLDTHFIAQAYSRLVVDCNRWSSDPSWIVAESDATAVQGNLDISESKREARRQQIYEPYHAAIAAAINERAAAGHETILVSLHSFTPSLAGRDRPWQIGVLHNGHANGFALATLACLQNSALMIGDNEPYQMNENDFTVPFHAFPRNLSYLEIEVRQDWLVGREPEVAALLANTLITALTDGPRWA